MLRAHVPVSVRSACMCTPCACVCTSVRVCASASVYCRPQPTGPWSPTDTTGHWAPSPSLSLSLHRSLFPSVSLPPPPSLHAALLPSCPLHPCNLISLDRMTTQGQPRVASGVRCVHSTRMATVISGPWPRAPKWPCKHLLPNPPSNDNDMYTFLGDDTLGQGSFGTWHMLPSISMVDSVACLRHAECSRAPEYITNGHGFPMQTTVGSRT